MPTGHHNAKTALNLNSAEGLDRSASQERSLILEQQTNYNHKKLKLMRQEFLEKILEQIKDLEVEELQEMDEVVQHYLREKKETAHLNAFHQSLLSSKLIKQIKKPYYRQIEPQQLIQVQGQPLSETILEERR